MKIVSLHLIFLVATTNACVTTGKSKRQDIVIRDFSGDSGAEIREAVESQAFKMKDQFRVIARDVSSIALTQEEAVKGKNKDDLFTKAGAGVKLREGLAGAKVLHGTCHQSKEKHVKKVLGGWMFGAYYPGEFEFDYKLYCSYRLINAETYVQEIAGDSEPVEWTNASEDGPPDPKSVRKVATEIINHIKDQLGD